MGNHQCPFLSFQTFVRVIWSTEEVYCQCLCLANRGETMATSAFSGWFKYDIFEEETNPSEHIDTASPFSKCKKCLHSIV